MFQNKQVSHEETNSQSSASLLVERLQLSAQLIEKEQSATGLNDLLNERELENKRLLGEKDELYAQVQTLEERLKVR